MDTLPHSLYYLLKIIIKKICAKTNAAQPYGVDLQWSQTRVANCGLVCCSWFSLPNECSATSVTHHWKGIFGLSQKSESEFLSRALTGPQWRRQFRRIRSGASERDGESMTCYTSLERKFQMQSIHRATISVAATRTGTKSCRR